MCKGHCQENKKTISEWENIFINHISTKRLKSRLYKGLLQQLIKWDLKMGKELEYTYLQRRYTNGQ